MQLNKDVFQFLLWMYEAGPVRRLYVDIKGTLPNQNIDAVCKLAWKPDGYGMYYPGEDGESYDIEEREPGQFYYFNRGWRPVKPRDIKQYNYRMDWLPQALKTGLHLSGDTQELLQGKLLLLGEMKHQGGATPIWLARELSYAPTFDDVYDALAAWRHTRGGIVLSSSRPYYKRLTLPCDYRIVDPMDLLNEDGYLASDRLLSIIDPEAKREDRLVYWDDARGVLYLKGSDPIKFSGSKNRMAITLLYERCLKKENEWNIQALLEEVDSSSPHISKLFKGNTRWKEAVGYGGGVCWLKIPESA